MSLSQRLYGAASNPDDAPGGAVTRVISRAILLHPALLRGLFPARWNLIGGQMLLFTLRAYGTRQSRVSAQPWDEEDQVASGKLTMEQG